MGYHTGSSSESSSYPIPIAVIRGKKLVSHAEHFVVRYATESLYEFFIRSLLIGNPGIIAANPYAAQANRYSVGLSPATGSSLIWTL